LFLLWLGKTQPEAAPVAIEAAIRTGLSNTSWPGRLEVITRDPLTVIDVGHTPDGVRQALVSLKAAHGADGWLLVLGISFDKKADEIARVLAPSFDTIICTSAHHKGAEAETVAAAARRANAQAAVHVAASIEDAFHLSQGLAATQQRKIYAAGGLFLAIEYATLARGGRTKDLHFL
jgi:dihydrofolate synthase/folylpolyglutamate synthase